MSDPRDDRDLQAWLDGDSPLSRRYADLGDEQPPAELDARILAEASEASKIVPLRRSPLQRWSTGIGLAATVVLGLGVVVQLGVQPDSPTAPAASANEEVAGRTAEKRERPAVGALGPGVERKMMAPADFNSPSPAGVAAESDELAGLVGDDGRLLVAINWLQRTGNEPVAASAPFMDRPLAMQAGRASSMAADRADDMPVEREEAGSQAAIDARLAAILEAWQADDPLLAQTRLDDFISDYPDHPLSRQVSAAVE